MSSVFATSTAVTKQFTFDVSSTDDEKFRVIITRPDTLSPTKRSMFVHTSEAQVSYITTSWNDTTKVFSISITGSFNSLKGAYKFDILFNSFDGALKNGAKVYKSFGYILV